jgi:hypothetical protein
LLFESVFGIHILPAKLQECKEIYMCKAIAGAPVGYSRSRRSSVIKRNEIEGARQCQKVCNANRRRSKFCALLLDLGAGQAGEFFDLKVNERALRFARKDQGRIPQNDL